MKCVLLLLPLSKVKHSTSKHAVFLIKSLTFSLFLDPFATSCSQVNTILYFLNLFMIHLSYIDYMVIIVTDFLVPYQLSIPRGRANTAMVCNPSVSQDSLHLHFLEDGFSQFPQGVILQFCLFIAFLAVQSESFTAS